MPPRSGRDSSKPSGGEGQPTALGWATIRPDTGDRAPRTSASRRAASPDRTGRRPLLQRPGHRTCVEQHTVLTPATAPYPGRNRADHDTGWAASPPSRSITIIQAWLTATPTRCNMPRGRRSGGLGVAVVIERVSRRVAGGRRSARRPAVADLWAVDRRQFADGPGVDTGINNRIRGDRSILARSAQGTVARALGLWPDPRPSTSGRSVADPVA
jgi:hypothetical protein